MASAAAVSSYGAAGGSDDFLTEALLNRSEHKPRPPPSKNSSSVLSNLQQQDRLQQKKRDKPLSGLAKNEEPEDVKYFSNRRTSTMTYKPTKTFNYSSDSNVDLSSPFLVGSAEILRKKAETVSKSASFAAPTPKPMLRCRSIRPTNQKQGPSVSTVPLIDDQWILSEKEQDRLALKEGVGFGKAAEDAVISFPLFEDVKRYPQQPQSNTKLSDDVWRDSLGLSKPLPGSIDYKTDLVQKHMTSYRGPLAKAIKSINIVDKQEQLDHELVELQIAEKEKRDYVRKMKEEQQRALVESNLPSTSQPMEGNLNGGMASPLTAAAATSTTNATKLVRAIKGRKHNIEMLKKELHDEIKGRRWRGELSSFRSTVARSSFLDEALTSSNHGDISHIIEQEISDKERSANNHTQQVSKSKYNNTTTNPKLSASFASRTGRVPVFGDVGGNIMATRALPMNETWEPQGSMEVERLKLRELKKDEILGRTGDKSASKLSEVDSLVSGGGGGSAALGTARDSVQESEHSYGLSSLISALAFGDDEGDMDIDEMIALRAQRRNAMQARLVAEEAAKMPTVLSDWLVRYKVESLKSSLASQFGINTMADIIQADEKKMDWILYTVPKGMRERFTNMVLEIRHKDDLSFALSEATGSASFGVEARRSSAARPSLKTLYRRISRTQSSNSILQRNGSFLHSDNPTTRLMKRRNSTDSSTLSRKSVGSSTISEHSTTIINSRTASESVKEYEGEGYSGEEEEEEDGDRDGDEKGEIVGIVVGIDRVEGIEEGDDEGARVESPMSTVQQVNDQALTSYDKAISQSEHLNNDATAHIKQDDDSDSDGSNAKVKKVDIKELSQHFQPNAGSAETNGNEIIDRDQDQEEEEEDSDSSDDEDLLLLYETNEIMRQRNESIDRNKNRVTAVSLSRLKRGGGGSNASINSLNNNSNNNRMSSLGGGGSSFREDEDSSGGRGGRRGSILAPVPRDKFGRKGPASLSVQKILQPNVTPSQLAAAGSHGKASGFRDQDMENRMMDGLGVTERNRKKRNKRVGISGDQLGYIKPTSLSETLKQEISDERRGRLLYNSTPTTLSHMDQTLLASKNRYLSSGQTGSKPGQLISGGVYSEEKDLIGLNNSSIDPNHGGAVSAFKSEVKRSDIFLSKDMKLTASLEYNVQSKTLAVKDPEKPSTSFISRERPPLFVAQTGSDFNYGAKFPPKAFHFIETNPHNKSTIGGSSVASTERSYIK